MASAAALSIQPPASPFAQLLRRSRFASFDPAVRQTYSAPPSHAHRGNWGLKRPIALRRKNAFITIPAAFESPAQYIEWSHAESQVRFIRRIEEMQTQPRLAEESSWNKVLGSKNRSQWLIDSEFCTREEGPEREEMVEEKVKEQQQRIPADLAGLGQKGPGNYGTRRTIAQVHLTPNINAMSQREFERYIRKLRELRPAFQKHIASRVKEDQELRGKTLYQLSQNAASLYHRQFLAKHTSEEFGNHRSQVIEQRPHPNGGLMYSHLPAMHSHYFAKPQPSIVLHDANAKAATSSNSRWTTGVASNVPRPFIVSFGGMASIADSKALDVVGAKPLLDLTSEKGIEPSRIEQSIAEVKLAPGKFFLERLPETVGTRKEGLKAVLLRTEVKPVHPTERLSTWPGSFEYMIGKTPDVEMSPSTYTQQQLQLKSKVTARHQPDQTRPKSLDSTAQGLLINTLRSMSASKNSRAARSDEGL